MHSLADMTLESNSYCKFNFNGGSLSSDAGLLLVKEFAAKIGFEKTVMRNTCTLSNCVQKRRSKSALRT